MVDVRLVKRCTLFLLTSLLIVGCAGVTKVVPRPASAAFEDHEATVLGRYLAREAARHPGDSGFALIRDPHWAFVDRVALADLAEKSLDLQYYIWAPDSTGRILADRLVRAADRGVRVRVLLDDINLSGRDAVIATLDAHPNIEIRVFNPFSRRRARGLELLADFNRLNHRMHNKLMVADNAVAILGGRNIGDHYFGVDTDANFRDLDIAAGGPVVRQASAVFDRFWNGPWSIPIASLAGRPYTGKDLERLRQERPVSAVADDFPLPLEQGVAALRSALYRVLDGLIWAPGRVVWDDPESLRREGKTREIGEGLASRLDPLEVELLIESAYFVPRDHGVTILKGLRERGVRVRVLTNSLASNDVLAAHAGYSKRRRALVEAGVELHELRPDPGTVHKAVFARTSRAALHTKAIVFDRRDVFIGSLNLDPRSGDINTEIGLYVESPRLAAQVIDYMDEGASPENSYRVLLDDDGKLYWVTRSEGNVVRYDQDPQSSAWQRAVAALIRLLPLEDQL